MFDLICCMTLDISPKIFQFSGTAVLNLIDPGHLQPPSCHLSPVRFADQSRPLAKGPFIRESPTMFSELHVSLQKKLRKNIENEIEKRPHSRASPSPFPDRGHDLLP